MTHPTPTDKLAAALDAAITRMDYARRGGNVHPEEWQKDIDGLKALTAHEAEMQSAGDDTVREAYEALKQDYKLLADELVYHGNSVSHWYAKGTAYKAAIGKVCDIARKHGIIFDGKTDVADLLDDHLTRATAPKPCNPQSSVDALYGYQAGYEEGRASCDEMVKALEETTELVKALHNNLSAVMGKNTIYKPMLDRANKALATHRAQEKNNG